MDRKPSAKSGGELSLLGKGEGSAKFPVSAQLRRTSEYRRVYDHGRRRQFGWLAAFLLCTGSAEGRVGITVPRQFGDAVSRNRMKRRLRHAIAACTADLPAGWDIVLHPRVAGLKIEFGELVSTLRRVFAHCAKSSAIDSGSVADR